MISFVFYNIWSLLMIIEQISGISYNLPKLCANATWNPSAITFANSITVGNYPHGIFVNTINNVYVADHMNGRILIWLNDSTIPTKILSGGLNSPTGIFSRENGDIYIDNGYVNYRIDKWGSNSTSSVPAMYTCSFCTGVFVDINDMLYCAMFNYHQVISKSLNQYLNIWSTVAGKSNVSGSTSTTLNNPCGIFVDLYLNLYVADFLNNRIQKFSSGQLNGTTISTGSFILDHPSSVILDADGYFFIVDMYNHRIVGSGLYGFRCIAACSGSGSSSTQLYFPQALSFDSYGNIFLSDQGNHRIQKFLVTNTCINSTISTQSTPLSTMASGINFTGTSSSTRM
ncbi:unnamed protein product [Adineta ricciae]|uniref:NHL repeat containing protein-like protein n=1 Tax=Adineta ricciae TaxID=249248 RepID=A0A815IQ73_ADIRI|nr:unnamed protein product [Adineta ricciae]